MDSFCLIWSKEANDPKLDEPWGIRNFGLQYRGFWNIIFDDLNTVHDIESVYTFIRNLKHRGMATLQVGMLMALIVATCLGRQNDRRNYK